MYQTQFRLTTLPSEAILYVCGLGFSSVSVNGATLDGIALVTAPWTANERLVGFSALNILPLLRLGTLNNLTISLGMGWRDQSAFGYIDANELQNDKTPRVLRAQLRTSPNTTLTHTVSQQKQAASVGLFSRPSSSVVFMMRRARGTVRGRRPQGRSSTTPYITERCVRSACSMLDTVCVRIYVRASVRVRERRRFGARLCTRSRVSTRLPVRACV